MSRRPAAISVAALLLARFCALTADQVVTFTLPVAVYLRSGQAAYAGAAFFMDWLPRTLAMPLLGVLVDRSPASRQLPYVDLARAGLVLGACLAPRVAALMVLAGMVSMFNAYASLLIDKLITTELPGDALSEHQARLQTLVQIAKITSPACAGMLLAQKGAHLTLLVSAALFAVSLITNRLNFRRAVPAEREAAVPPAEAPGTLAATARLLLGLPPLRQLQLLTFCINLTEGGCAALLPIIVIGYFQQSARTLGYVNGGAAAASVLVLVLLIRRPSALPLRQLGLASVVVMYAAALFIISGRSLALLAGAYAAFTAARNALSVYLRTERLRLLPRQWLGRALGLVVSCDLVAFPLAGAIVTLSAARASPFRVLLGVTAVSLISTCLARRPLLAPAPPREPGRAD